MDLRESLAILIAGLAGTLVLHWLIRRLLTKESRYARFERRCAEVCRRAQRRKA